MFYKWLADCLEQFHRQFLRVQVIFLEVNKVVNNKKNQNKLYSLIIYFKGIYPKEITKNVQNILSRLKNSIINTSKLSLTTENGLNQLRR